MFIFHLETNGKPLSEFLTVCYNNENRFLFSMKMQQQVGHEHASTTSIYTCVSSDFRTRTLRRALDQTMRDALNRPEAR